MSGIGTQELAVIILVLGFMLLPILVVMILRKRYPNRLWIGILLCLLNGGVAQFYLPGGTGYFIGVAVLFVVLKQFIDSLGAFLLAAVTAIFLIWYRHAKYYPNKEVGQPTHSTPGNLLQAEVSKQTEDREANYKWRSEGLEIAEEKERIEPKTRNDSQLPVETTSSQLSGSKNPKAPTEHILWLVGLFLVVIGIIYITNRVHDHAKTKELEETRKRTEESLSQSASAKHYPEMGLPTPQFNDPALNIMLKPKMAPALSIPQPHIDPEISRQSATAKPIDDPFKYNEVINHGTHYLNLKEYQQALENYDRAIQLNPNEAVAYIFRGVAYYELGNYQQAIKDYDRAIQLDPNRARAYHYRGSAFSSLGNYQQAIKDYDRAIELDPKLAMAYSSRGFSYWELGQIKAAQSDLRVAARLGFNPAQEFLNTKGIGW